MNDIKGEGGVFFRGTALHLVSLGRLYCSASMGLIRIKI